MRVLVCIFAISGMLAVTAQAGDQVLTLESALIELRAANPDIQAAQWRAAAARARVPQAKALDDPMIGVMFEDVPIDTANVRRGDKINYRLQQDIPFPGKRFVRGKTARFDATAAAASAGGRMADVIFDFKATYYELYRLDRALAVNRELQGLWRQLTGSTETGFAAGKMPAHVPIKAHVELAQLRNEAVRLTQQRISHAAHVQALLNRASHQPIRLPRTLAWPRMQASLATVQALAQTHRPELQELSAMEQRDTTKVTQAKQTLIPDFSFTLEYNQRPAMQDAWTGAAMVNLPLYVWKNRGAIREARAELRATAALRQSAEVHTQHEIAAAYSAVQAARTLMTTYAREIVPQARVALASTRTAYGANNADFLSLLEATRTLNEIENSYYDTQAEYGTARATLERLVGMEIE